MIRKDELIEWVEYCGNYYGTPREFVLGEIEKGHIVVLEIEVEGADNVRRLFPDWYFVSFYHPTITNWKTD